MIYKTKNQKPIAKTNTQFSLTTTNFLRKEIDMKMQNRIISLLLVLSLLLGSIVFTVSADSGDTFEPTATIAKTNGNSAYSEYALNGGNHILDAGMNSFGDDYTSHIVTPTDGSTHYLQITSQADDDGQPDNHVQYTWRAGDGNTVVYDASTPVYVVFQMDIATESDLIHFAAVARISNKSNSDRGGTHSLPLFGEGNPVDFAAGEFHRYTQVQDWHGNKIYHFVDGVLVASADLLNEGTYASWKADADGWYSGFKFQAHSSYGTTPVVEGETLLVANAQAHVIRGTAAAGNLPTALAASNLATWTGSQKASHEMPKIPAIASVDGVKYNNVKDLNNALTGGTQRNVVLLRDSLTKFTVDCDAKITTNGFSTYKLADGATTSEANGVVTVTAAFEDALTRTDFAGSKNMLAQIPGNNIAYAAIGNAGNSPFLTINKATTAGGDEFIQAWCNTTTSYNGASNNLFINAAMNGQQLPVTGSGAVGYYVIDFDVMTQGEILPEFDVSVVMRQGTTTSGFPFSDELYISGYVTEKNSWSHVTIVGDVANNVARIYVNGVYMGNGGQAVRLSNNGDYTTVNALGFRIELTRNNIQTDRELGQNVAFDNLSHRLYADGNASLKAAINAGDITAWDAYVEGKAGQNLPTIATVNGVSYNNTSDLAVALTSNDKLTVEFGTTPVVPVSLRADSVIDTNGLVFDKLVSLDSSAKITGTDGNYVTVDCAFISNKESEAVSYDSQTVAETTILNAVKGNAANNLLNRVQLVTSGGWGSSIGWGDEGYRYGEIVTNPFTGDTIYYESARPNSSGKITGTNEYENFLFDSITLSYESGKNEYIVVDYDFAITGNFDSSLGFSLIPRTSGSGRWATTVNLSQFPISHDGTMVHITAVHDFTNNKAYYFFDGVLGLTVNSGAINDTGYTEYKNGNSNIKVSEYKLGSNSINTYYIDNMNIRFFDIASGSDTLATAINAKDIAKWSNNIYHGTCTKLPALATINGDDCYTAEGLSQLILNNPGAEVEILHDVEGTFTLDGVAKINTNGFDFNVQAAEGGNITWDGEMVYVASSNLSESVNGNGTEILNAIKYNGTGNLLSGVGISATGGNGDEIPWGAEGGRGSSLVSYNGNTYYHEYLVGDPVGKYGDSTYGQMGNDYVNYNFSTVKIAYTSGNNEYVIVDYDIDYTAGELNNVTQQAIARNIGGTSWATTQQLKNFGLTAGEFNHVTTIYDYTTAYAHIFVNGKLTHSVQNGALKASNHTEYLKGTTGGTVAEFRVGSNTYDNMYIDNMYVRYEKNAVANDTIAAAINTGYLFAWSGNIYTDSYEMPTHAPIATVNGVDCYNEAKLQETLLGRHEVEVEFWRSPSAPITVTADAVIDTHGFLNVFTVGAGAGVDHTSGTVTHVSGAFKESATYTAGGDGTTAVGFSDMANTTIPHNIFHGGGSEANVSAFRYFKYTDYDTKNPYYMINPVLEKSTKNTYINVGLSSNPAITATSYFIFDMDFATETEFIEKLGITIQQRSTYNTGSGGTDFNKVGDTDPIYFSEYTPASGEWAHATIVGDIADNMVYIFIDGVLVHEQRMNSQSEYDLNSHINAGDFKCHGLRVNMGAAQAMDLTASTLIGGLSLRYYSSNDAACNIESAISAKSLTNYALVEYGRMSESLPSIATVNGVEYGNYNDANAALKDGKKIEASLDRQSIFGGVELASTGTVKYNGMEYTVALGYVAGEAGGIVTVAYNTNTGHVHVSVNGETIYEGDLQIGTNVAEILESFGSVGTKVVVGNGSIFTNVTWNEEPGYVLGDVGYSGTGTKVDTLYFVHQNGTPVDLAGNGWTNDEAGLYKAAINGGADVTVVLNGNATIPSGSGIGNNKNIYLNGYSLSFEGGNHAMSMGGNGRSINFYGPGVINDMNSTNTQGFMFAGYNWTGKITLNNLTLNASQSVLQLRSGSAEINNCVINGFVGYDSALFMFGEDYNGSYSTTPIHIDIVDSYVSYRITNTRTGYAVSMFKEKVVTTAEAPAHEINITGSTLIAEYGLFNACETISGNTVEKSNTTFNVQDSKLVADTLVNTNAGGSELGFFATVNFIDNVSINSTMTNLGYANIAGGLEIAKSNDHLADKTYTSEYATVTWADGTTDFWVNGSVPVNAARPLAKVQAVEAGESYDFSAEHAEIPFALSANLTLGASIKFNLYVPVEADLQSVVVNGKALVGREVAYNNTLCYCYSVELTPTEAASAFDVVFTLADSSSVARTLSVAQYATAVYASYGNETTVNMMSNTLQYIKSSARYFGVNADVSAIDDLLAAHAATSVSIPTTTTDTSALSEYISGVQLNVMSTLKFRFNLKSGVNGNSVKITVNGEEKAVEVYSGYVEVALRAYEMGDTITISVNGATGTYDLATYCNYVKNNGSTAAGVPSELHYYHTLTNANKGNLISAIYSYYAAAKAYKA